MNRDYAKAMSSQLTAIHSCDMVRHRGGIYNDLASAQKEAITEAIPFFWNAETASAVLQASKSIPGDTKLSKWNLPCSSAWWYFEEPIMNSPTFDAKTEAIDYVPTRALSMFWSSTVFVVTPWSDSRLSPGAMFPCGLMNWPESQPLDCMAAGADSLTVFEGTLSVQPSLATPEPAFILAALAWLEQRVLVEESTSVHRAVRREFEHKLHRKPDDVRVVQLRRSAPHEHVPEGESQEHVKMHFSVRWVVDGHWRNQPCGAQRADRRLTWIDPYLKGPDNAPLNKPKPKIYAVVR